MPASGACVPADVTVPTIVPGLALVTVTVAVALLLEGLGSAVADDTVAVFVTVPVTDTVVTAVTVAAAPVARVPSEQLRPEAFVQEPWVAAADTSVSPAGSGSVM